MRGGKLELFHGVSHERGRIDNGFRLQEDSTGANLPKTTAILRLLTSHETTC